MSSVSAYYYGCWRQLGHYLWLRGSGGVPIKASREDRDRLLGGYPHTLDRKPGLIPWGYALDGGLLRGRSRLASGEAVVEQRDGWTAISFVDRSVDHRPGSNSTFAFERLLSPETALESARAAFPPIFERFEFEVQLLAPTNGVPPMPKGFRDRSAWDAIHFGFAGNGCAMDVAVRDWQLENQERCAAAARAGGVDFELVKEEGT